MPQLKTIQSRRLRFVGVGLINTSLDITVYAGLVAALVAPVAANYISTSCGLLSSYYLNKYYTFNGATNRHWREIALFLPVTIVGLWILQPMVIHYFSAFTSQGAGGMSWLLLSLLAKLLATGLSMAWNYFWYSRLVFKEPKSTLTR